MNSIYVILIRYLLIFASIFLAIVKNQFVDPLPVIIILSVIVLMQINMHFFRSGFLKVLLTMTEIILIYISSIYVPALIFTLHSVVAVDTAYLEDSRLSNILFMILLGANLLKFKEGYSDYVFASTIFMSIVFLMFLFVKREHSRKLDAQELYDRLRVNEVKLKEAYNELELYADSIEEITRLRERNRISRDIHDSVGHSLSTILIQLGAIEKLSSNDERVSLLSRNLQEFTRKSLDEVRKAVRDLKPDEFKTIDALVLIDNLLNQQRQLTKKKIIFSFSKDRWKLDDDQSTALYRIVEEFLGNANKYGGSTKIYITLIYNKDSLNISLKDNGNGTDSIIEGFGLKSMRERIDELGGRLTYSSSSGEGFMVNASIPRIKKFRLHKL